MANNTISPATVAIHNHTGTIIEHLRQRGQQPFTEGLFRRSPLPADGAGLSPFPTGTARGRVDGTAAKESSPSTVPIVHVRRPSHQPDPVVLHHSGSSQRVLSKTPIRFARAPPVQT